MRRLVSTPIACAFPGMSGGGGAGPDRSGPDVPAAGEGRA
jgi:hypothetical protein